MPSSSLVSNHPSRCTRGRSLLFNFEGIVLKRRHREKKIVPCERKNGGVAQLGEHLPCKQGVDSSILFISTMVGREVRMPRSSATEMGS